MNNQQRLFQQTSNLCVFLFFALSLTVKSGYSYGAAILLVIALCGLPWWKKQIQLRRIHYCLLALLALNALIGFAYAWRLSADPGGYNRPARYLACMLLLLYFSAYPPKRHWLWWGIAVGAIAAGVSALYYTYGGDPALTFPRASRYLNAIQFGNSAALLGILSLCGLSYARQQRRTLLLLALPLGCVLGLTASLLSESRGGWVALLIAAVVFIIHQRHRLNKQQWCWLLLTGLCGATLLGILGKNIIQQRWAAASHEIAAYVTQDNEATSVGARLSMWHFALHEGISYPIFGPGRATIEADKKAWAAAGHGHAAQQYGHLHNEYLNLFATRGLVGLSTFLALLIVPLSIFRRYLNKTPLHGSNNRDIANAGYYLIILHAGFGLTQVSIHAHNSGFMLFTIPLCLFSACLVATHPGAKPASPNTTNLSDA